MAEPTNTNATNTPAPEGQAANPSATGAQPVATGEDFATLKAKYENLVAHLEVIKVDQAKTRQEKADLAKAKADAEKAAEDKLREQGDHVRLKEIAEAKARALEAQLADVTPKAERLTAHEKRVTEKLNAAKAAGDLPPYLVRAIDAAQKVDVDDAADILAEFRASQANAQPAKQAAPHAPAQGAAPASQPAANVTNPKTVADLKNLKASDPGAFSRLIGGGGPASLAQSFQARLTRMGTQKAT